MKPKYRLHFRLSKAGKAAMKYILSAKEKPDGFRPNLECVLKVGRVYIATNGSSLHAVSKMEAGDRHGEYLDELPNGLHHFGNPTGSEDTVGYAPESEIQEFPNVKDIMSSKKPIAVIAASTHLLREALTNTGEYVSIAIYGPSLPFEVFGTIPGDFSKDIKTYAMIMPAHGDYPKEKLWRPFKELTWTPEEIHSQNERETK